MMLLLPMAVSLATIWRAVVGVTVSQGSTSIHVSSTTMDDGLLFFSIPMSIFTAIIVEAAHKCIGG